MEEADLNARRDLRNLSDFLTSISARILQVSNRKASVAMGAATNVAVGSVFAASVTGIVGALGSAGTGVAIAGLSGAAKTSATFAWIGGLVGGGVAAGTLVLGAGTLGAGIYGSIKVRRAILRAARRPEEVSEAELRILEASSILATAIRETLASDAEIGGRDVALMSRIGIKPLVMDIDAALQGGLFGDLNVYNRARLRGHVNNLRSYLRRLDADADPS